MLVPQPEHQGIHVRNFLALFVCISLVAYIHFELNQATSTLENTNAIVNSMLNNQTYTISQERLFNLEQSLKAKTYHELSQAQCLTRIYLDVLNNEKFIADSLQRSSPQSRESSDKIELTFIELVFPSIVNDLEGFRNCSDILTLMNFLNPTKTDFIYTKFMQEKYGSFIQTLESEQNSKSSHNQTKFCILTNQFNTSTTKLRQNINSVIDQSYQNYRLVILDNGSKDGSYEIAKVILEDLKERLTKENAEEAKALQQKYQIIKEQSKLGLWELYKKHDNICQGMDFVIFVDGRDSLPTRHTLNILNNKILSSNGKPSLITAPLLKRKQLSHQSPAGLLYLNKIQSIPTFTFKVISLELLNQTKDKLVELTQSASHSFEVEKATVETLLEECKSNNKSVLQVDQMLYVYDTIQNKQIDRNEYYIAVVRKQLAKGKKQTKKEEKKAA